MLERTLKYLVIAAVAAAPLTSCSYLSSSGRQQMAYQRYVRKMSGKKMKLKNKIKAPKVPKNPGPSENNIKSDVTDSPQSVRSSESGNN
jgi:uncharacterized lipoprotein